MIRYATADDAASVSEIYNHYIFNTVVTFEEEAVTPIQMVKRIMEVQGRYPWLVYELDGKIIGYAYANAWKTRAAYRHTVESSVYLDPAYTGKGIGTELYGALVKKLEASDIHLVIGGIAQPNDASIRLHESLGFVKTGQFNEVGLKFGKWVDVAYWELLLPAKKSSPDTADASASRKHAEHYY